LLTVVSAIFNGHETRRKEIEQAIADGLAQSPRPLRQKDHHGLGVWPLAFVPWHRFNFDAVRGGD